MKTLEYDLVALGGGTAGLVSAAGASYLGLKAALVEASALGGDCLWTGCVPTKALVASARLAHAMRGAERWGLRGASPGHAFSEVMARMKRVRGEVARHDDPERFRKMGVDVHFGAGHFLEPGTLEVEGVGPIRSKRIVLATGAHPWVPSVEGLEEVGFLTHLSAFDQETLPGSILILGGGPVGLEFAQVYRRLGAKVTVLEILPGILGGEDPEAASQLQEILEGEGIRFRLGAKAVSAGTGEKGKVIRLEDGSQISGKEIFVATGRRPNTGGLELARVGVEREGFAVRVDSTLRTTGRGIWAAGDVTGGPQFTHAADHMAKTVLRNALFPFRKKVDYGNIPRVIYTDPEVAHVGLPHEEAQARGGVTYSYPFHDLDRAMVDGESAGFVKVTADRRGRILGATILGHGAGELIAPLVLARGNGLPLDRISNTVFPYPTRAEGVKRAADAYQRARLEGGAGKLLKRVLSWLK